MSGRYEMRFTGSGGQGVILASVVLAEAAVLSGLRVVQSQAYGPEARGGMSRAETILSREEIWFPKVLRPNFLLALTQPSLDKYAPATAPDAVILLDDTLCAPAGVQGRRILTLPILRTARETVGRVQTANIVAVGAINAALELFSDDVLREAVRRHIPAGTEKLNFRALEEGGRLPAAAGARPLHQSIA